ncbi:hypothetical protein [Nocardioides convexus]|nr:hypothetical protein [Nocardioides convexus]
MPHRTAQGCRRPVRQPRGPARLRAAERQEDPDRGEPQSCTPTPTTRA